MSTTLSNTNEPTTVTDLEDSFVSWFCDELGDLSNDDARGWLRLLEDGNDLLWGALKAQDFPHEDLVWLAVAAKERVPHSSGVLSKQEARRLILLHGSTKELVRLARNAASDLVNTVVLANELIALRRKHAAVAVPSRRARSKPARELPLPLAAAGPGSNRTEGRFGDLTITRGADNSTCTVKYRATPSVDPEGFCLQSFEVLRGNESSTYLLLCAPHRGSWRAAITLRVTDLASVTDECNTVPLGVLRGVEWHGVIEDTILASIEDDDLKNWHTLAADPRSDAGVCAVIKRALEKRKGVALGGRAGVAVGVLAAKSPLTALATEREQGQSHSSADVDARPAADSRHKPRGRGDRS